MIYQLTPNITPATNKELAQLIKELRETLRARKLYTEMWGTWSSPKTLFNSENPAIKVLVGEIGKALEEITALPISEWEITGWANIFYDENKMHRHNHRWHDYTKGLENAYAGVYYVETPPGTITFSDPTEYVGTPDGMKAHQSDQEIEVEAGLLLLFSANHEHYVKPHKKPERERVSIAFNVRRALGED